MTIKVLYHDNCMDGFGAAYAAWKALGEFAEYIPCRYGQHIPSIEPHDYVYVVDFSYPRSVLLELYDRCLGNLLVLDHHKTAQEDLQGLPFAKFNMYKSGAELAWEHWHPNSFTPDLIKYVADRDLWKKELLYSEEVHRALRSFPTDFYVWNELANMHNYVEFMRRIGEPIYKEEQEEIKYLIRSFEYRDLFGLDVACISTTKTHLVSDALNQLCKVLSEHTPYAVNYYTDKEGQLNMSFRSVGDFDVSEVAKKLGGGGHKKASGAVVSLDDPLIQDFLR